MNDDFTAKLCLYYISEILVVIVNQRMFNIVTDSATEYRNTLLVVLETFEGPV